MAEHTPGGAWLPSNKNSFPISPEAQSERTTLPPASTPAAPTTPAAPAAPATPSAAPAVAPSGARRVAFSTLMAAILVAGVAGGATGSALTVGLGRNSFPVQTASAAAPQVSGSAAIADTTGLKAIYKQVSPAVVSVQTTVSASAQTGQRSGPNGQAPQRPRANPSDPNAPSIPGFPNFPGVPGVPGQGAIPQASAEGTGFIIDGEGNILTNNHVIEGASKVTVVLADGTRLAAQVVGTDPGNDLALIKASIPAGKTAVATLGDSDAIEPGDTALAIGTPFGLDHTLTAGIVSAVNRDFGSAAGRPMHGLIQTDAAINPGNSGGPLLNANGEVIGITTSIESPVRANVGVGFAIPINQAKQLLPQLKAGQSVQHAWLGISGAAVSSDQAGDLGVPSSITSGVAVIQVAPNSPAANAGLRGGAGGTGGAGGNLAGDVIVAVDGKAVNRVQDIAGYLDTKKPGDTVTLTIIRDGARQDVRATLAPWPEAQPQS